MITSTAQHESKPLAAAKQGLESSLARVAQDLEKFFRSSAGEQALLQDALVEFRNAGALMQSLSLHGAVVFCTEIETLLQAVEAGTLSPSFKLQDTLKQALDALIQYLDTLVDGSKNSALGLFTAYKDLKQARGAGQTFEVELFFPDLQVELPPSVMQLPVEDSSRERIRAERSKYQASLLKWLRQGFAADDLLGMRNAVLGVMKCLPQNQQRAYWWVASAMLDCLISDDSTAVMTTMKLLSRIDLQMKAMAEALSIERHPLGDSRIDLQMKALAEGRDVDTASGMTELLYLVACSHAVSDTISQVKQVYELDSYFPKVLSLPASKTDPVLEAMRAQLGMAQEGWERSAYLGVVSPEFTRQQQQLSSLADQLDRNTLQYLCSLIQTAVEKARNPEQVHSIKLDMAIALLLLDSGIEHYRSLGDDFHRQTRILGKRLKSGLAGELSDEEQSGSELAKLIEMYRRVAARDMLPLLAVEMLDNFRQMEQGLGDFFQDSNKRSTLEHPALLLKQAKCLLHILSLDQAERLLITLQQAVERYVDGIVPGLDEKKAVAIALKALRTYAHELSQGQQSDIAPLLSALQPMQALQQSAGTPAVSAAPEAALQQQAVDAQTEANELLDIFLEEAQGVLERIGSNLELISRQPDNREALLTVRRGFHTLKGSGRMVGLTELGDVAAEAEGAMNRWLQSELPATPELCEFIREAEAAFHGWVDSLLARGTVKIEAVDLVSRAQRIAGATTESVPPVGAPAAQAEIQPEAADAQSERNELLDVFLEEAQTVLERIRSNLEIIRQQPDNREALLIIRRGCHTLKGSGRMVGLTELGEVAAAVEGAMNKWLQSEQPATPELFKFVGEAEADFRGWVDSLRSTGGARIEADDLVATAQRIALTTPTPSDLIAAEMDAEVQPAPVSGMIKPENKTSPPAAPPAELIVIGSVKLSPALFAIATEEAAQHISEMSRCLKQLRSERTPISDDFMRAAHTLAGVNRIMGFPQIADLASALELWLVARMDRTVDIQDTQISVIEAAIAALDEMSNAVYKQQEPQGHPDLVSQLQADKHGADEEAEASVQLTEKIPVVQDMSSEDTTQKLEATTQKLKPETTTQKLETTTQKLKPETTTQKLETTTQKLKPETTTQKLKSALEAKKVNDDVDQEMLPIFMEEANELFPKIGESLRAWRAHPDDKSLANTLQRSLHTLKGGARMAGAMRLGEQAHLMESCVVQAVSNPQDHAAALDELESLFDSIGNTLERLRGGELTTTITEAKPGTQKLKVQEAPVAQPEEQPADTGRVIKDDVDEQLLPIFLEEANDLLPQIGDSIKAWKQDPDDNTISRKLQRDLHTLKGGARMAGAMRLGELIHRMESQVIDGMVEELHETTLFGELESYFDRTNSSIERLLASKQAEAVEKPEATPEAPAQGKSELKVEAKAEAKTEAVPEVKLLQEAEKPVHPKQAAAMERNVPATMLRVRSDTLDYLVNEAGEISVTRSRVEAELRGVKAGMHELLHSVVRLRQQLREIEIQAEGQMQAHVSVAGDMEHFDPLEFDRFTRFQELTRFMNESVHDVQTVQQGLLKNLDETAAALSAQNQINRALQQNLLAIRMVPFSSISERLYRIVRQTCKELNKKANLELYGTEVELDRSVLEKMTAPFEHLLRNAIAHGLESAEQRALRDKPPIGDVRLSLRQEGNEVAFEFSDDGGGLDLVRLRQKGYERGIFQAGEEVSDEQAMQLVFAPGLSTAESVTAISGRGVGMDVVRSEITALGGRIDVFTVPEKGTRFIIHLPLTLLVSHTLMMQVGETIYAVPSSMVEQVQQLKPAAMEAAYENGFIEWQEARFPLHYLLHLLGDEKERPEIQTYNPLLLLRSGDQRIAVHVDALIGIQEVVVKNIGPQLSRLPGIAGATVLGNGSVLLILNPVQLKQRLGQGVHKVFKEVTGSPISANPLVMVVDDSLTVRKITSRMLTRAGYQVQTAEDGVDALEKLNEVTPGVILMDIEMPRMDGFELTRILHNSEKTRKLPIIMITSRIADKHRDYAKELGVNEYLGKPYQEDDLLQKIAQYAPLTKTQH